MKKILIADPSEPCCELAVMRLENLFPQVEIVVVKDGLQAHQAFMQYKDFDVLLINPYLPHLPGTELAKEYKQKLKAKGLVIASTADVFFPNELYQYFDKVIFKPWQNFESEILECLNQVSSSDLNSKTG